MRKSPETKGPFNLKHSGAALRIVSIYAAVGALWIFFSDGVLRLFVRDPDTMSAIAMVKGWLYVGVTAALLFLLIDQAIKSLLKADEERKNSEARYRKLFENSGDALIIHQAPDWKIADANTAALSLFGFPQGNGLQGISADILSPETQPDGEPSVTKAARMLQIAFETGTNFFQWRCKRKDGSEFNTTVRLTRIDLDDRPAILAAVRDTTEIDRIEAEKKEMERRLLHAQKVESLGVLVGGIAHDFNNLLTVASGNIELALVVKRDPREIEEALGNAKTAIMRAAQLTRQMLDYARKGKSTEGEFNLNEIIAENAELLRAIVPRRIVMELDLAATMEKTLGDPGQIHQVVMNLLTNAAEAITQPHGKIRISTRTDHCDSALLGKSAFEPKPAPGDYAIIDITDNGTGMSAETIKRIFEPFYTTKITGRGLGMAMVMSIIQNHKGALLVQSTPGEGTTMKLCLPLAIPLSERQNSDATQASQETRQTQKAVLLAEDDRHMRNMVANMLKKLGYDTLIADDGPEAIALWKENRQRISVALIDINMPTLDGLGVLREITQAGGKTPVILTSGYLDPLVKQSTDASGFLKKPFTMGELGLALSKALAEAE